MQRQYLLDVQQLEQAQLPGQQDALLMGLHMAVGVHGGGGDHSDQQVYNQMMQQQHQYEQQQHQLHMQQQDQYQQQQDQFGMEHQGHLQQHQGHIQMQGVDAGLLAHSQQPPDLPLDVPEEELRRRWTAVEEAQLKALIELKTPWAQLAVIFNRSEDACRKHYSKTFATGSGVDIDSSGGVRGQVQGQEQGQGSSSRGAPVPVPVGMAGGPTPNKWLVKPLRRWTAQEDEELRKLVEEYGRRNWTNIAAALPSRTPDACECRWRDKLHPKILMMEKDIRDQILQNGGGYVAAPAGGGVLDATQSPDDNYATATGPSGVSSPGMTYAAVGGGGGEAPAHAPAHSNSTGVSGVDRISVGGVGEHVPGGHGDLTLQARYYSREEDELLKRLIDLHGSSGSSSWDKIAQQLPGRTANSCRMRWKQALRHQLPSTSVDHQMSVPLTMTVSASSSVDQTLVTTQMDQQHQQHQHQQHQHLDSEPTFAATDDAELVMAIGEADPDTAHDPNHGQGPGVDILHGGHDSTVMGSI